MTNRNTHTHTELSTHTNISEKCETLRHAILDTLLAEKVQSRQQAIPVCAIHIAKHFCILNTCFTPHFKRKG